jgi:hypothetical protein
MTRKFGNRGNGYLPVLRQERGKGVPEIVGTDYPNPCGLADRGEIPLKNVGYANRFAAMDSLAFEGRKPENETLTIGPVVRCPQQKLSLCLLAVELLKSGFKGGC